MTPQRSRVLAAASLVVVPLAALLVLQHRHPHSLVPTAPISAPTAGPAETLTLLIANDADGSLRVETVKRPLVAQSNRRTQAILSALFAEYALPQSTHPLAPGPSVWDVSLTDLPSAPPAPNLASSPVTSPLPTSPRQIAVVNLTGNFVASHPSGIEPETLTLLSVIATLRANQPRIAQVRFLVDGRPRDTLAGHADLTRTYLASDPEVQP